MPAAFLYDNVAAGAALFSGDATFPTMPISNLQDPQPRRRVRFDDGTFFFDADFLSAKDIDVVALISTTLNSVSSIRLRLSDSGTFSSTVYDSGFVFAEASNDGQGNVIMVLPGVVSARYMRINVFDGGVPFIDVGVLAAGQLWRVMRGMAYGVREGRVMLDRRDRNPFTGAEFPVPAIANPRFAAFTLPSLATTEARNQHRDLVRLLGAARDGLVIMELNDTMAERNRRAIWGAINVPGEDAAVSRDNLPLSSRAFRIQERL
jgi:hypothetical protein